MYSVQIPVLVQFIHSGFISEQTKQNESFEFKR